MCRTDVANRVRSLLTPEQLAIQHVERYLTQAFAGPIRWQIEDIENLRPDGCGQLIESVIQTILKSGEFKPSNMRSANPAFEMVEQRVLTAIYIAPLIEAGIDSRYILPRRSLGIRATLDGLDIVEQVGGCIYA